MRSFIEQPLLIRAGFGPPVIIMRCPKCSGRMKVRPNKRVETCENCGLDKKHIEPEPEDVKFKKIEEIIN